MEKDLLESSCATCAFAPALGGDHPDQLERSFAAKIFRPEVVAVFGSSSTIFPQRFATITRTHHHLKGALC